MWKFTVWSFKLYIKLKSFIFRKTVQGCLSYPSPFNSHFTGTHLGFSAMQNVNKMANIRLPLAHTALFSYSNLVHQHHPKWGKHPLYLDQDWHYALLNNPVSSKPFTVILNFAELNLSTTFQMGGPSYQRKPHDKEEWSFSTQSLFHLCSKVCYIRGSLSFHTTHWNPPQFHIYTTLLEFLLFVNVLSTYNGPQFVLG